MSPLLKLPAELRNTIYDYVLSGYHVHYGIKPSFRVRTGFPKPPPNPLKISVIDTHSGKPPESRHPFALLRVCLQLYSEATVLPHRWSGFSGTPYHLCSLFNDGLFKPYQLEAITQVKISINEAYFKTVSERRSPDVQSSLTRGGRTAELEKS
jgi:hypothetical protein